MQKMILIIVGLIVVAGVVVFMVINRSEEDAQGSPTEHITTNTADSMSDTTTTTQQPNEVIIKDFVYGPEKLTIAKGTTVTWTNKDSDQHDVTPDSPSDSFVASPLLSEGETYSFTFNEPGIYEYHCSPHPFMKATVEVTE